MANKRKLNTIPELLGDIAAGRMIVLMDDESRENEGDLIMAASKVRPEDVNFMARFGRGLICLPLTRERCRQLQLPLMVNLNQARYATNFTVSIEAAEGITTGISAYDRAETIQCLIDANACSADLSRPGHIFPLRARDGGVLVRTGQTEASVDLARIAGLNPAGVICEIMKEDGTMARMPDLEKFSARFGIPVITVEEIIKYRVQTDSLVELVSEAMLPTQWGCLLYTSPSPRDRTRSRMPSSA